MSPDPEEFEEAGISKDVDEVSEVAALLLLL